MAAVLEKYLIEHRLVFDTNLMTLSNGDTVTALAANETELLTLLMRGIATKQAVIEQVWESKGMVVTEGSYHQLVRSLRLKLEEQGLPGSVIKTLPRLGLKFLGIAEPVTEAPASQLAVSMPSWAMPISTEGAHGMHDAHDTQAATDSGNSALAAEPLASEIHGPPRLSELGGKALPEAEFAAEPSAAAPATTIEPPLSLKNDAASKPRRSWPVVYAIYAVLIVWAGVLGWKTFFGGDSPFEFPFAQTADGVHYFSNGKMAQKALLQSIHVTPAPGSYVYQIGLGNNDWLAVCPKSIYEAPQQCETYFVEKAYR
jgi:DNA-binding winged helix-turn-helix (wHTH) protein